MIHRGQQELGDGAGSHRVRLGQRQQLIGGGHTAGLIEDGEHLGHGLTHRRTIGLVLHGAEQLAAAGDGQGHPLLGQDLSHRLRQLLQQLLELILGSGQLVVRNSQGGAGLVQLLLGLVQLLLAVLVLRQALFIFFPALSGLPLAVLIVYNALGVLLLAVIQLDLGVRKFFFCIGEFLLGIRCFLGQGLLTFAQVRPAVVQLGSGVQQLLPGVGKLLLCLRLGVVQLLLRLLQLLVGVVYQLLPPEGGAFLAQRLQSVDDPVQQVGVVTVKGGEFLGPLHQQKGGGIGVHVEGGRRQVHIGGYLAGAQGGGAPFHTDVIGAHHGAHNGKGGGSQGIGIVPLGLELEGVSHLQAQGLQEIFLHGTFVRCLRQSSVSDGDLIDALRQGPDLHHDIQVRAGGKGVDVPDALHIQDVRLAAEDLQVLLRQAQGGHDLDVHEVLRVQITVAGVFHVRRGGAQT